MNTTSQAFFQICTEATVALYRRHVLSLYRHDPFYGGPEEGGWWGEDRTLVAYQVFPTEEALEAAKAAMDQLVKQLDREEREAHHRGCAARVDWLERRGLDSDFLPEEDGPSRFSVRIEEYPGEGASLGNRRYE